MRPVNLPAGLEDKGVEIYIYRGRLRVIYDGQIISFEQLPERIRDLFSQHMMANRTAIISLKKDFGIENPFDMLKQYIICNFGNFDGQPDMSEDGVMITECWDCGHRGTCRGEGRVCSRLQGPRGLLTRRETEIFFLVIEGKYDKEIAEHFGVSLATIETQLKYIREKLGVNNRIEIMKFALSRKFMII